MKMKKIILLTASVLFSAGILFMTGCKKDDTTPPVVTVVGTNPMTISLNVALVADLGATAKDDKDGDITKNITSDWTSIDVNMAGTYTVKYSVSDAAGNVGTATRTVNVVNDAMAWEGTYHGSETDVNGLYTYNPNMDPTKWNVVTASTTVNNRILLTRLGDYANNTVYLTVAGTSLTLPSQTVSSVGTGTSPCNVHDRKSDGTGTKTATGFTLTYNDSKVSPCTGTRTSVAATFVKY